MFPQLTRISLLMILVLLSGPVRSGMATTQESALTTTTSTNTAPTPSGDDQGITGYASHEAKLKYYESQGWLQKAPEEVIKDEKVEDFALSASGRIIVQMYDETDGVSQLYEYQPDSGTFKKITFSPYDHLNPIMVGDEKGSALVYELDHGGLSRVGMTPLVPPQGVTEKTCAEYYFSPESTLEVEYRYPRFFFGDAISKAGFRVSARKKILQCKETFEAMNSGTAENPYFVLSLLGSPQYVNQEALIELFNQGCEAADDGVSGMFLPTLTEELYLCQEGKSFADCGTFSEADCKVTPSADTKDTTAEPVTSDTTSKTLVTGEGTVSPTTETSTSTETTTTEMTTESTTTETTTSVDKTATEMSTESSGGLLATIVEFFTGSTDITTEETTKESVEDELVDVTQIEEEGTVAQTPVAEEPAAESPKPTGLVTHDGQEFNLDMPCVGDADCGEGDHNWCNGLEYCAEYDGAKYCARQTLTTEDFSLIGKPEQLPPVLEESSLDLDRMSLTQQSVISNSGRYAYLPRNAGIEIVDLQNRGNSLETAFATVKSIKFPEGNRGVSELDYEFVEGRDILYSGWDKGSIARIDVTDPANPQVTSSSRNALPDYLLNTRVEKITRVNDFILGYAQQYRLPNVAQGAWPPRLIHVWRKSDLAYLGSFHFADKGTENGKWWVRNVDINLVFSIENIDDRHFIFADQTRSLNIMSVEDFKFDDSTKRSETIGKYTYSYHQINPVFSCFVDGFVAKYTQYAAKACSKLYSGTDAPAGYFDVLSPNLEVDATTLPSGKSVAVISSYSMKYKILWDLDPVTKNRGLPRVVRIMAVEGLSSMLDGTFIDAQTWCADSNHMYATASGIFCWRLEHHAGAAGDEDDLFYFAPVAKYFTPWRFQSEYVPSRNASKDHHGFLLSTNTDLLAIDPVNSLYSTTCEEKIRSYRDTYWAAYGNSVVVTEKQSYPKQNIGVVQNDLSCSRSAKESLYPYQRKYDPEGMNGPHMPEWAWMPGGHDVLQPDHARFSVVPGVQGAAWLLWRDEQNVRRKTKVFSRNAENYYLAGAAVSRDGKHLYLFTRFQPKNQVDEFAVDCVENSVKSCEPKVSFIQSHTVPEMFQDGLGGYDSPHSRARYAVGGQFRHDQTWDKRFYPDESGKIKITFYNLDDVSNPLEYAFDLAQQGIEVGSGESVFFRAGQGLGDFYYAPLVVQNSGTRRSKFYLVTFDMSQLESGVVTVVSTKKFDEQPYLLYEYGDYFVVDPLSRLGIYSSRGIVASLFDLSVYDENGMRGTSAGAEPHFVRKLEYVDGSGKIITTDPHLSFSQNGKSYYIRSQGTIFTKDGYWYLPDSKMEAVAIYRPRIVEPVTLSELNSKISFEPVALLDHPTVDTFKNIQFSGYDAVVTGPDGAWSTIACRDGWRKHEEPVAEPAVTETKTEESAQTVMIDEGAIKQEVPTEEVKVEETLAIAPTTETKTEETVVKTEETATATATTDTKSEPVVVEEVKITETAVTETKSEPVIEETKVATISDTEVKADTTIVTEEPKLETVVTEEVKTETTTTATTEIKSEPVLATAETKTEETTITETKTEPVVEETKTTEPTTTVMIDEGAIKQEVPTEEVKVEETLAVAPTTETKTEETTVKAEEIATATATTETKSEPVVEEAKVATISDTEVKADTTAVPEEPKLETAVTEEVKTETATVTEEVKSEPVLATTETKSEETTATEPKAEPVVEEPKTEEPTAEEVTAETEIQETEEKSLIESVVDTVKELFAPSAEESAESLDLEEVIADETVAKILVADAVTTATPVTSTAVESPAPAAVTEVPKTSVSSVAEEPVTTLPSQSASPAVTTVAPLPAVMPSSASKTLDEEEEFVDLASSDAAVPAFADEEDAVSVEASGDLPDEEENLDDELEGQADTSQSFGKGESGPGQQPGSGSQIFTTGGLFDSLQGGGMGCSLNPNASKSAEMARQETAFRCLMIFVALIYSILRVYSMLSLTTPPAAGPEGKHSRNKVPVIL